MSSSIFTVLAIGSNMGDRVANLQQAVDHAAVIIDDITVSAVYESPALLPDGAPASWDMPFLNLAISGYTSHSPQSLLDRICAIEETIGRPKEHATWSPRIIDIDIMLYGDQTIQTDRLTIPHHGLLERAFFLLPLADLLPEWRFPLPHSPLHQHAITSLIQQCDTANITQTDIDIIPNH